MIVRCTRNNANTTTALTRRPFVQMSSSNKLHSRLSRSSNNSLKSSSGSNRTSFKSTTSTRTSIRNNDFLNQQRNYKEKYINVKIVEPKHEKKPITKYSHAVLINEPKFLDKPSDHKKAFMEASISIPTTINEESSRHNSLIPITKLTPTPSMEAINEETSSTYGERDKNKIELLTFAILTNTKSSDESSHSVKYSSDSDTPQIRLETYVVVPSCAE